MDKDALLHMDYQSFDKIKNSRARYSNRRFVRITLVSKEPVILEKDVSLNMILEQ